LNEITWTSFSEFLCNLFLILVLRNKNVKVFNLYNAGVPLVFPEEGERSIILFDLIAL